VLRSVQPTHLRTFLVAGFTQEKTSGHSILSATEGGLEKSERRSGVRRETGYEVTCSSLKFDFGLQHQLPFSVPYLAESLALMRGKSG